MYGMSEPEVEIWTLNISEKRDFRDFTNPLDRDWDMIIPTLGRLKGVKKVKDV